jgi:protein disulfide-isomerase
LKYLKWIFIASLLFTLAACNVEAGDDSDKLNWNENLEEAIKIADEENKTVFINFTGSDWCKWCIKLSDEVFTKQAFENYAKDNLVLVKLDFPRNIEQTQEVKDYNRNLMKKYQVQGFPTVVVLNKDGERIGTTGYVPGGPEKYVKHLEEMIKPQS